MSDGRANLGCDDGMSFPTAESTGMAEQSPGSDLFRMLLIVVVMGE